MAACDCSNIVWVCVLAPLFTIYVIRGTLTNIAKFIKPPHSYLPSGLLISENTAYNHDYYIKK